MLSQYHVSPATLRIIYSLLLVVSVGFIFIAIGTKKLQAIEEV
jgi:hypothetical protein